jgi:hypothetical protein
MKRICACLPVFVWMLLSYCTKESPTVPSQEMIVVRAYLFAGEPVSDIQLTNTIPLGSQETKAPPINDAAVSLSKNGVRYDLVPSAGDSGYYHYPNNDLVVQAGDRFEIDVLAPGQEATGATTVPPAPDSVAISSDTLVVSDDTTAYGPPWGGGSAAWDSAGTLTVTWKSSPSALFFVVVENMESNPDTIETHWRFSGAGTGRMVSEPTSSNQYRIRRFDLSYYGRYRVTVYRVNQEYADLYGSRQQDSRDLNEPLTNIQNGLGVFSAFNSSEVYFEVVKQ